MLGAAKPRRLDQPIAVSLDELVPNDHFYRHLEAKLDLGFVRSWARQRYADRGRTSIDPVVFFKLQLVMFFEGIRSERQLIATASLNLAHRWYLGYALDEALPDHSSLSRRSTGDDRSDRRPGLRRTESGAVHHRDASTRRLFQRPEQFFVMAYSGR